MSRSLGLVKLLVILAIFYGVVHFGVIYASSQPHGVREPYLQLPTAESVVVRWQTMAPQEGVVRFGTRPDGLDETVLEGSVTRIHEVRLTGLTPETRYYYSIGDTAGHEVYRDDDGFRTMPKPGSGGPVRIWVMGDEGKDGAVSHRVRDAMLEWVSAHPRKELTDIDVWLSLGDMAYGSGTDAEFQRAFFEPYASLLHHTPVWPVFGNHDARRHTYFNVFSLPAEGEAGGTPSFTEHYYSFDYGDVHFVMLDSESSSLEPDGEMLTWLKHDLAANDRTWLIASLHHPPYTKGSHDSDDSADSGGRMERVRENVVPVLEAAGVDLVLSGHSHVFERSHLMACHYGGSDTFREKFVLSPGRLGEYRAYVKPLRRQARSGTVYVVAGAASKVGAGPLDHPAMVRAQSTPGSMVIDIADGVLTARYVDEHAQVVDQFTISREPDVPVRMAACPGP